MNPNHHGRSVDFQDAETDGLWRKLEAGLAYYLAQMIDPDDQDILLLELPGSDSVAGCTPYAQFAVFGEGAMLRAELSGNAVLAPAFRLGAVASHSLSERGWSGNDETESNWFDQRPVADAAVIARKVVRALRTHFGIAHPQLLTYHAWGPASDCADVLGLCATDDVPADEAESTSQSLAVVPDDREHLIALVAQALTKKFGSAPTIDDDGDFVLEHLGQAVWVRVRRDQPGVEIFARVAHEVYSRRAAAVEIGLLNRDNLWVRWVLRDRMIWQNLPILGAPFVPSHLTMMLDLYFTAMSETRDDLALRTGGKVA